MAAWTPVVNPATSWQWQVSSCPSVTATAALQDRGAGWPRLGPGLHWVEPHGLVVTTHFVRKQSSEQQSEIKWVVTLPPCHWSVLSCALYSAIVWPYSPFEKLCSECSTVLFKVPIKHRKCLGEKICSHHKSKVSRQRSKYQKPQEH